MTIKHYIYNLKYGLNSPIRILSFLGITFLAVYLGSIPLKIKTVQSLIQENQVLNLFFLLLPFVLGFIAIVVGISSFHKLNFKDLVVSRFVRAISYKRIVFSFLLWFVILSIGELIFYSVHPENYIFNQLDADYIFLLLISLVMVPIQTSFEELLIRSYLTQQFYLLTTKVIFSILFGSVIFAFMHLNNPEIEAFGLPIMFSYYFLAGIFLATLSYKDGRMELAIGLHAANNIFSAIIVNYSGSVFKTKTIAETIKMNVTHSLGAFCVSAILFYLICRYKFKWGTDFGMET